MIEVIIQNTVTGDIFDISTLCHNITYYTDLNGQPGKFTCLVERDPNHILQLVEGSILIFKHDGNNIFFGYVFTIGTDSTEAYKITAYDQLRYFKNVDTLVMENMTSSMLFNEICKRMNITRKVVITPSMEFLPTQLFNNKTYFDMINEANMQTLQKGKNKPYFFIRDNFGMLEFNELKNAMTTLIIGDGSLLTDYKFETSIDTDTYNRVKIIKSDKKKGTSIEKIQQDVNTIARWGVLQKLITVDEDMTEQQIGDYARLFLSLKNSPVRTIRLYALGDDEIKAGNGFHFQLAKLNLFCDMYVTAVTHKYDGDVHTMDLDVSGIPSELYDVKIMPKENLELAYEVLNGLWGNGEERRIKLTDAGYNYAEVQKLVNILVSQGIK